MTKGRKQVAFDLDTKALKEYYPSASEQNAYADVRRHMNKNGFLWQQGSVYVSEKTMSNITVIAVIAALVDKCQWLNVCMRDCVVTNMGKEHNLNYLFNKSATIQKREEKKEKAEGTFTLEQQEKKLITPPETQKPAVPAASAPPAKMSMKDRMAAAQAEAIKRAAENSPQKRIKHTTRNTTYADIE